MVTDCKIQLVDMLEQILEKIADGQTQTLSATDDGESLSFPLKNSSEVGLEVALPPPSSRAEDEQMSVASRDKPIPNHSVPGVSLQRHLNKGGGSGGIDSDGTSPTSIASPIRKRMSFRLPSHSSSRVLPKSSGSSFRETPALKAEVAEALSSHISLVRQESQIVALRILTDRTAELCLSKDFILLREWVRESRASHDVPLLQRMLTRLPGMGVKARERESKIFKKQIQEIVDEDEHADTQEGRNGKTKDDKLVDSAAEKPLASAFARATRRISEVWAGPIQVEDNGTDPHAPTTAVKIRMKDESNPPIVLEFESLEGKLEFRDVARMWLEHSGDRRRKSGFRSVKKSLLLQSEVFDQEKSLPKNVYRGHIQPVVVGNLHKSPAGKADQEHDWLPIRFCVSNIGDVFYFAENEALFQDASVRRMGSLASATVDIQAKAGCHELDGALCQVVRWQFVCVLLMTTELTSCSQ